MSEYGKIGKRSSEFMFDSTVYPDMNNRPILLDVRKNVNVSMIFICYSDIFLTKN